MRGSRRPHVTSPDKTRVFYGQWPQSIVTRQDAEAPYIAALAKRVRGIVEVTLPAGRADVANDTHVFEVEPVRSWRKGAQQAFAYGGMAGLRPVLALFGAADYLPIYLRIRDRLPGLELWVWTGAWSAVTSRTSAPSQYATSRCQPPDLRALYPLCVDDE